MANADVQSPATLTDPPTEDSQVNGSPENGDPTGDGEVSQPAEGDSGAPRENGDELEEQQQPKKAEAAAKAKQEAQKEKERKQAEEELKKQAKLREKEEEKARKQQEKEAKEAAKQKEKEDKVRRKQSKKVANVQIVLLDGTKHAFTVPVRGGRE